MIGRPGAGVFLLAGIESNYQGSAVGAPRHPWHPRMAHRLALLQSGPLTAPRFCQVVRVVSKLIA